MSLETNIGNAVATFVTGVTLSLSDRLFSKNAKRFTEERIKEKFEQVEALNYLDDTEQKIEKSEKGVEERTSIDYHNAVVKARDYFENSAQYRSKGLIRQVAEKIRYSKSPELINKLKAGKQFALAMGIELVYDGIVLAFQTIGGIGNVGKAFARTLYQGPALFLGMQAGKGALYVNDWVRKSKDEKELDSMAKDLTKDGKLFEIVKNYSPTAQLKVVEAKVIEAGTEQQQLPAETEAAYGTKVTDLGEKVGAKIADTAEGISKSVGAGINVLKERMERRRKAKEEAEKRAKDKLRSQYENY